MTGRALDVVRRCMASRSVWTRCPGRRATRAYAWVYPDSTIGCHGFMASPEGMQGPAEVHHEIADTLLPPAEPVLHDAAALDTPVDMLDPEPPLVAGLVRHVMLPRELLPQIEITSIILLRDEFPVNRPRENRVQVGIGLALALVRPVELLAFEVLETWQELKAQE